MKTLLNPETFENASIRFNVVARKRSFQICCHHDDALLSASNKKTLANFSLFDGFLDPHFSPFEVSEVYVVSVNLETINKITARSGRSCSLCARAGDEVAGNAAFELRKSCDWTRNTRKSYLENRAQLFKARLVLILV